MTGTPVPLSRRNIVALDGIRGLAIVAVMFNHFTPPEPGGFLRQLLRLAFTQGGVGVDLFFVLSGFLISGILLDTRECTNYFRSFYSRRALRIFPLYYGFLLFAWLVFPHIVEPTWLPIRADWWLYPTYLSNWHVLWKDVWHPNVVGHFWSLAVEEQFYLLWPLVLLVVPPRRLLSALTCLEIAIVVIRGWWVLQHGPSLPLYFATITKMDGLLFGAACAVVARQYRVPLQMVKAMPWFGAACLSGYLAALLFGGDAAKPKFTQTVGWPILATGFGALVLYTVLTDSGRTPLHTFLRWKPLTRIGKYAYGIYVFHVPLFYFVGRLVLHVPAATRSALWFRISTMILESCLAFAIASISYHYFEKRFLALKGRFEPEYPKAVYAVSQS